MKKTLTENRDLSEKSFDGESDKPQQVLKCTCNYYNTLLRGEKMNNQDETMSIVGGLQIYGVLPNVRYKSDTSPYGRKVKFLNKNGYDAELENARRYFKEGQILTINEILVDKFSSEVVFVECPGKKFNTVMFADVKEENKFNIGDEIKIIDAGIGATGCNGRVGYVTETKATRGLFPDQKGFNVLIKAFNVWLYGKKLNPFGIVDNVWRVNLDGKYELIKKATTEKKTEKPTPKQKAEVLIYDRQSFKVETLVRDTNMNIIDRQQKCEGRKAHKCIYNGLTTIVILSDGSKGIAKCNPKDTYNKQIGYDIAYCRAKIKSLEDELNFLCENAHLIQITKQVYEEFKKNILGDKADEKKEV